MTDALERLKNRNRPTVPNRDASLTPPPISADTSTSRNLEAQVSTPSAVPTPAQPDAIPTPAQPEAVPPLQTKQSTLRMEVGVSDRLQEVCRDNGLCREVLIEAMFEFCEHHQDALQSVLIEARIKNEQRQQIANQKRAKSMMQRFGQSGE